MDEIIAQCEKWEGEHDQLVRESRLLVRHCAKAIQAMHHNDLETARGNLAEFAEKRKALGANTEKFKYLTDHPEQEWVEAMLLLHVKEKKALPNYTDLKVDFTTYLLGLCDFVGELRREMIEKLKDGEKKEAEELFALMEGIHEELAPLRFSNALLPGFRVKQDMVRGQVERARSELLRSLS